MKKRPPRPAKSKASRAASARLSGTTPKDKAEALALERDEALLQQAATAEILRVISTSPADTQPVFEAIVQSGLKLFPDAAILIVLPDGDKLRAAAFADTNPGRVKAMLSRWPIPLTREYNHAVAILDRKMVDIPDGREVPSVLSSGARYFLTTGYRAITIMPMMRGREAIGALSVVRVAPGRLSKRQIGVLKTFAAQAVIAIENTRVLNELRESLQQQTATADVLKIVSVSPGDMKPVFEAMLTNAMRLCEAKFGHILLYDGERFHATYLHDVPKAYREFWEKHGPIRPDPNTGLGRIVREKRMFHIPDLKADIAYTARTPLRVVTVEKAGARSFVGVPMLKDDKLVGAIVIYRQEVRPFTERQIELLQNFAAQAVIAIENTRLLNELRERTNDLSESLEQQTATSEVLKVISSSPGELEPVFNAMLANATRICEATFGHLWLYENNTFRAVAVEGTRGFVDYMRHHPVIDLQSSRGAPLDRLARTRQLVHIADLRTDDAYIRKITPQIVSLVETSGARTFVSVPMLKEGELVGAINLYRQEVRPFSDRQIELVQNFAAQAVIAIENTRLLNELRQRTDDLSESLEQQTATSEVLKIVSSSPGELKPVFQAMLEQATRICDAKFGIVFRYDGGLFHPVASLDLPHALADFMVKQGAFAPRPGQLFGRLCESKTVISVVDRATDPDPSPSFRYGGARSSIAVPMLKDGELVGALFIYRTEVHPFTDKQIDLVKNFAAQAVIAIENTRLLSELRESLQQQTATSDVLKVISSSPGELEPVFGAMLEKAVQICGANFGNLFVRERNSFRIGAFYGAPPAYAEFLRTERVFPFNAKVGLGQMAKAKKTYQIDDISTAPTHGDRLREATIKLGGARTVIGLPMLKDGEVVGAIVIYRQEVRRFTDKQIELVQNFAAQAVIAIENTRLLSELRESLQQQTATADVLKVISASPGSLEPVFQAILASATDICQAGFGTLSLYENGAYRSVALHNPPPQFASRLGETIHPHPDSGLAHVTRTRQIAHIEDIRAQKPYLAGDPAVTKLADSAGARTILIVPMLKDEHLVGTITIYRQEVRPFNDKQIDLVKNFAAQAVIAIENARLLSELRESLDQQTATSEVLKVISSSPGTLKPVFDAMLENAIRICEAQFGNLFLREGEYEFRAMAVHGESVYANLSRKDPLIDLRERAGTPLDRFRKTEAVVHIDDLRLDESYGRDSRVTALVDSARARTVIVVPMLNDKDLIGGLVIYRTEVRPFSNKQIELLNSFAAQAVIAIENTRLLSELRESLQQQTATADVLKVISSSPGTLDPVFSTMLAKATELCEASYGTLWLHDGGGYRAVAMHGGLPPVWIEQWRSGAIYRPGPDRPMARAAEAREPIQVADMRTDPSYLQGDALPVAGVEIAGIRTLMLVPMFKDSEHVGLIAIYRTEVLPFTEKQIDLVKNFAAQAVIAIENTRLLSELRESLQQQTATADVLKVISASPGDLEPVFEAILGNATGICGAKFGTLYLSKDDAFYARAFHNAPPAFIEAREDKPLHPSPESTLGRAVRTRQVAQILDVTKRDSYLQGDPFTVAGADLGGYRTIMSVPMLKDDEVIGAFSIYRQEVLAFNDKQIELVKNFAAQAVIAIENTRLLNELRESLQQQTATADVLKVISRSTFDLQIVLDTLVESVARLCEAYDSIVALRHGDNIRVRAHYGTISDDLNPNLNETNEWPIGRGWVTGRAVIDRVPVHVHDLKTAVDEFPDGSEMALRLGHRTILAAPLLREGEAIGAIVLRRLERKPFTEKQIELVQTFADQAVIAIENARLLGELRESLQQQTATADVLKVISRSTFDLGTVLQTLVESVARLCDADRSVITRERNGVFYRSETYGFSQEWKEYVKDIPIKAERGSAFGRALLEGRAVQIADAIADPEYTMQEVQRLGDYRTILAVPMLREGSPIGVVSLVRKDVRPFTDKQIELASTFADQAAIAIENVRLFENVEARTRELAASLDNLRSTQDRLVQTQKLASLGQLTAGIAHEIKNPLNFVNNFSTVSSELIDDLQDTLKGLAVDDKRRKEINEITGMLRGNLDKVVEHGKRADSIVKNMLLHSREGSGEHRVVDINALVEESLNLAYHGKRAETQGFNVTLERSLDPAAGEADVFPQDITRVLLNLISNGFYAASRRKAQTGDGFEPVLAAATKSLGDRVEIRIRDNGTGIPPEVREKMFNPFFTTKPAGEGTGLGLSISHDIVVKQHAGSIEVDTQADVFTEIRIILPRKGAFPG